MAADRSALRAACLKALDRVQSAIQADYPQLCGWMARLQPRVRAAYLRERAQETLGGTSAPHWSPEQCARSAQQDLDEARHLDPSGEAGYVDPRDGGAAGIDASSIEEVSP